MKEQEQPFQPPSKFTDLDGREYFIGNRLTKPKEPTTISYFIYQEGGEHQRIIPEGYLQDVLREREKGK